MHRVFARHERQQPTDELSCVAHRNIAFTLAEPAANNMRATVALRAHDRAPRIALRERITNVDNCCTIDYIANFLGHADLCERMMSDGLLHDDGLPYQQYLDCGYFAAVESHDPGHADVFVTPWGMSWLLTRYGMTDEARFAHQAAKEPQ